MRHIPAPFAGATVALFALFITLLSVAPAAEARTALAELRVEGPGTTLDPGTWYVTGNERIRKSKPGDACVRAKGRIAVNGPTPLSLVQSGSEVNGDLSQVRVRRDEAGLFVCEIGSVLGRPFSDPAGFAGWSYYRDWEFGSAAADEIQLRGRTKILWVFSDFGLGTEANTGPALELRRVPARSDGEFVAKVVAHGFDGTTSPVAGATIEGAPAVELANGRYRVNVGRGTTTLRATRGLDIPSNQVETCMKPKLRKCPSAHGRTIVGSPRGDGLRGTKGWDTIKARGGRDRINLRKGGRDFVNCGGGKDVVLLRKGDRDDRLRKCERVRRS